jgi:hypothetical protein
MRCDCGALTYYGDKEKDRGLCEDCYVGSLEAIAMQYPVVVNRLSDAEKVIDKAREVLIPTPGNHYDSMARSELSAALPQYDKEVKE